MALAALCGPVWADTFEIRDSSEGHLAEVYYSNSRGQNSTNATVRLDLGDVVVDVRVVVNGGGDGRERVTVMPHDPGLVAHPVEADVPDGEAVVIQIMVPMF